jgi:ATP-binding cassette subfamily B protein
MFPIWSSIRNQFGIITSAVQENIMGVRVVRGFAREDYEEKRFGKECETYFRKNIAGAKLRSLYLPLAVFLTSMSTVVIIWYGGIQVINKVITIGSLVAFYFYVMRLSQPVRMFGFIIMRFQRAIASAQRIFDIIDAKSLVSDKEGAIDLQQIKGHIVFKDVWFGYDENNIVLKNINLDVKPGETIAILGATGSGKSSIINLIPRFYDVTKGSITIDGYDIRDVTLKSLRKHIGIVRQDPFIFSSTIRENIAFGVENATQEAIEAAAKRAKIHDFIVSLPKGYNTIVGERGVTLSGGQKQRIAIARALLKDPKILILDDSTSSVDMQTEFEIQQALEELFENRTTFIITQRLSSIRKAKYIVVLEGGEIIEEGTHEQLMANKGIYYKLYLTQVTGETLPSKEGVN